MYSYLAIGISVLSIVLSVWSIYISATGNFPEWLEDLMDWIFYH